MRVRESLGPILLVGLLLLAGCTGKDPPGSIRNLDAVPANAPHEVGSGNFRLEIKLLAEHDGGEPIPGAALLIYPIEKPVTPPSIGQLRARNASYMARADATGTVVAHLIEGRTYSFQAAADNSTREFRHLRKMDRHLENPMPFILYNATKTVELTGTLQTTPNKVDKLPGVPGGQVYISGSTGIALKWLQNVTFHPLKEHRYNKEYVARLADVQLTLTWVNDPPTYADLGVRGGFLGTPQFWWESDAQTDGPGPASEKLKIAERSMGVPTGKRDPKFVAGPITRMPIYAPNGLPWKVVVEASFNTDPVDRPPAYCIDYATCVNEPGFEAGFAALAVAGGAWCLRRRRA